MTDSIIRELRLRRFTDITPVPPRVDPLREAVAEPIVTDGPAPLQRLSARHSRRRVVEDRAL